MRAEAALPPNREASWPRVNLFGLRGRGAWARSQSADSPWPTTVPAAVMMIAGFCLLLGIVGADCRWMAALGDYIVTHGWIPRGIPFAAMPTTHWQNVPVVGEVVVWAMTSALGDRGVVLLQVLAVATGFAALALDALRADASRQAVASTCLVVALGALPTVVIARGQLFSLALFPCLLALLRSDSRRPSRRVWLLVPLIAVWSNLHGAVVVGVAVSLIYLLTARLRTHRLETTLIAGASLLALCANPAGLRALSYYEGVLVNAAARRGEGLWEPLSLTAPADLLLVGAAIALALRAARGRVRLWEGLAVIVLAGMTIHASRSGTWLLFLLAAPAATGARAGKPWRRRTVLMAGAAIAAIVIGIARGPALSGANSRTVAQAIASARGTPILTSDVVAEQIALAGGRVWASNPIDAFGERVQVAYLEWLDGERAGWLIAGKDVNVVLVARGSPEALVMQRIPGFRVVSQRAGFELLRRTASRT